MVFTVEILRAVCAFLARFMRVVKDGMIFIFKCFCSLKVEKRLESVESL